MRKILSTILLMLCAVGGTYAVDAGSRNGIKGITMSIKPERIHRSGDEVQFKLYVTNNTGKDEKGMYVNLNQFGVDSYISFDGEGKYPIGGNTRNIDVPAGEITTIDAWISRVPLNAEKMTYIKIVGRSDSKSTSNNYYGDYDYTFKDIELPSFPESNKIGCVFHDNEISLHVGDVSVNGKDLVVEFALINNGRKDYTIDVADFGRGVARTAEGDEYKVATKFPKSLPVGEAVKGQLVITDGADETFATVRQGFRLFQDRDTWSPGLLLRNISKP